MALGDFDLSNLMPSGFFWGNSPNVNQQLRQRIALQMMANKKPFPKTLGEGLAAIGDALGDRRMADQILQGDLADQNSVAGLKPPGLGVPPVSSPDTSTPAPTTRSADDDSTPPPVVADLNKPIEGDQSTSPTVSDYVTTGGDLATSKQPSSMLSPTPSINQSGTLTTNPLSGVGANKVATQAITPPQQTAAAAPDVSDGGFNAIDAAATANDPSWQARKSAISGIESGGSKNPYSLVGVATRNGDRALGKYQVMASNVPQWTQDALGQSMTPQQFIASPDAQEAVFRHRFGQYVDKYGDEGAARAWFGGEGGMKNLGATDAYGRLTVGTYGQDYMSRLNKARNNVASTMNAQAQMPTDISAQSRVASLPPPQTNDIGPAPPAPGSQIRTMPPPLQAPQATPTPPPQLTAPQATAAPPPRPNVQVAQATLPQQPGVPAPQFGYVRPEKPEPVKPPPQGLHPWEVWGQSVLNDPRYRNNPYAAQAVAPYVAEGKRQREAADKANDEAYQSKLTATREWNAARQNEIANQAKEIVAGQKAQQDLQQLTEPQTKALVAHTWASQANDTLKEIKNSDQLLAQGWSEAAKGKIPFLGNKALSDDYRRADNAAQTFILAFMRSTSGAAYGEKERLDHAYAMLPKLGDDAKTLADKAAQRAGFIASEYASLGVPGQRYADNIAKQNAAEKQAAGAQQQVTIDNEMKGVTPKGVGDIKYNKNNPQVQRRWDGQHWIEEPRR